MANVNLKVIMRIGDNRTAQDMSEWIGLIKTSKKSISTGLSTSTSGREYTKRIEINKRTADSYRDGITIADAEEELVSAEELKHEMSAEKGLAYFDKGDGIVRKGRSIWFDAELPGTWEGREYLTKYEAVEADEIGLAEWVDEHIFSIEEAETERNGESVEAQLGSGPTSFTSSAGSSTASAPEKEEPEESGPFRLNPFRPFRGKGRSSTFFAKTDPSTDPTPPPAEPEKALNPAESHNTQHRPEEVTTAPVAVDEPPPASMQQDVLEEPLTPSDAQSQSPNREDSSRQSGGQRDGGRQDSRGSNSGRQHDRGGQSRGGQEHRGQDRRGQDRGGQDRGGNDRGGNDRGGNDRGGQARGGHDRGRNGPQQNSGSAKGEKPQQGDQNPGNNRPGENKMVFRGSRKDTVVRTKKVGM